MTKEIQAGKESANLKGKLLSLRRFSRTFSPRRGLLSLSLSYPPCNRAPVSPLADRLSLPLSCYKANPLSLSICLSLSRSRKAPYAEGDSSCATTTNLSLSSLSEPCIRDETAPGQRKHLSALALSLSLSLLNKKALNKILLLLRDLCMHRHRL